MPSGSIAHVASKGNDDPISDLITAIQEKVDKKGLLILVGLAAAGGLAYLVVKNKKKKAQPPKHVEPVLVSDDRKEYLRANPPALLILHQCPRGKKTPCISPYPMKLETFLRVNKINYKVDFNVKEPQSMGSPWVTLDTEDICDSENCVSFLKSVYSINEENNYDAGKKALSVAINHILENHLFWGVALFRWVYDGPEKLDDIQVLSSKTKKLVNQISNMVEQAAWFHGIGKKKPQEVIKSMKADLDALSNFLGNKTYFLGTEKPSEIDCTAFAILSQFIWNMEGSQFQEDMREKHKNLTNFCFHMKSEYWPDWKLSLNSTPIEDDDEDLILF